MDWLGEALDSFIWGTFTGTVPCPGPETALGLPLPVGIVGRVTRDLSAEADFQQL